MGRGRDGEGALLGPVTPVGPIGAGRVSDVGAVLGALDLDALNGLVGAFPRRLDGWPQGDDGQDPTSDDDQLPALGGAGAGMQHVDVVELLGGLDPCDGAAGGDGSGVAEAPEPTWSEQCAVDVVIAAPGYPGTVTTGGTITGIETAEELDDVHVLHAGTGTTERGELIAVGGRVLSVVALGATLEAARERAYEAVERINLEGAQYRTDIAQAASEGSVGSVGSAASADGAE